MLAGKGAEKNQTLHLGIQVIELLLRQIGFDTQVAADLIQDQLGPERLVEPCLRKPEKEVP